MEESEEALADRATTLIAEHEWHRLKNDDLKFNFGDTEEVVYADDPNAFRAFDNSISDGFVSSQLRRCQFELHEWDAANSVTFDGEKESFH